MPGRLFILRAAHVRENLPVLPPSVMADQPASSRSVQRRILEGTGWLAGWRMISRLIGFGSLLLMTQLLIPADFGLVALASSISASIDVMSQLGVRDALVRLRDDVEDFYDTAFTFQLVRGVVTGVLLAAVSAKAGRVMGDDRLQPILLVLAGLSVVSAFENIGTVRLIRELDFRTQVTLLAGPRLLGFAATVSAAFLFRSYWALVAGIAVSKVTSVAVTYLTSPHRPRLSLRGWRYLTHFSFWSWAGSIAGVVWSRSDPFVLGPSLGTALLGIFVVSLEIAILPVTELIEPVMGAMFPGFAMAHRNGKLAPEAALKVAGVLALGAVPFSVGISASSGCLIAGLLGQQWMVGLPVVATLAWLCMFSPFSYVCGCALSAQGHVRRGFYCNSIAAACKVVFLLATLSFTHNLEYVAAAIVAVVGVEASLFIWQLTAAGNRGLPELIPAMGRALFSAAITSGILWIVPGTWSAVSLSRFTALAASGAIGALAFALFGVVQWLLWNCCRRPEGAEAIIVGLASRLSFLPRFLRKPRPETGH